MLITFIGGGNMASAMIGGLTRQPLPCRIRVFDRNPAKLSYLTNTFGIETLSTLPSAFSEDEILILAVKPQGLKTIAISLREKLKGSLVVSIAAGIKIHRLTHWLNTSRIVRAMPNTPVAIGRGICGLYADKALQGGDKQRVEKFMSTLGEIIWLDTETNIDDLTCITGSGPAYVFYFIEAMVEAAQRVGFNPILARKLALATFSGAAELAKTSDIELALLRMNVTSKEGATERAIAQFEKGGVKPAIISGIQDCYARAVEIGQEWSQE